MKRFAQLYRQLDSSNKINDKIDNLVEFFRSSPDEDRLWALYFLTGNKIKKHVTSTQLKQWTREEAGIPDWLFKESYQYVGDLSETIALLFPQVEGWNDGTLQYWVLKLEGLKQQSEGKRRQFIVNTWKQLNQVERFAFNKLLSGSFRVGVSAKTVVNALAKLSKLDAAVISHRLSGNWHPQDTTFEKLILSESATDDVSRPYPFCLAYALDKELEELGVPGDYLIEWKWDGVRAQIISREGELFIWSRGEDLVTDAFPELHELLQKLPDGTAIDGEIAVFKQGRISTFNDLQARLGRKKVSTEMLEQSPVKIIAYDLLEVDGEDIRQKPAVKRRKLLEDIVDETNSEKILLSELVEVDSWQELERVKKESREKLAEGLMLKGKQTAFEVGRKKGVWWKWKVDPFSLDTVLLYAQRGHGRRANLYTDFTLAVWDDEGSLVPIAKAYSGLTDDELKKIDKWIKQNTKEKFGPVRSVKAEQVFEIGFEGIQKSNRHKSGVSLRFPRILRWRHDKPHTEANKLSDAFKLLEIYEGYGKK
jgi:DNA ligase-1